jgi:outer membrane protein assembly factor BamB
MLLQSALDAPGDVFINAKRRGKDGKDTPYRASLHAEAERIIRALPAEGLAYYRTAFQKSAADLLKETGVKERRQRLEEISRRFLYTAAGGEALESLAIAEFHVGHPRLAGQLREQPPALPGMGPDAYHLWRAALAFERLLDLRGGPDALSQPLLFKAAVAFRSVGEVGKSEQVWRSFAAKVAKEGMLIKTPRTLELLRAEVDRPADWPMVGGNPSRSGQAKGEVAYLEPLWRRSLFGEESKDQVQKWVTDGLQMLDDRKTAAVPAFMAIASNADVPAKGNTPLVVYRDHWGLRAVNVKSGELAWDADCKWSLEQMYNDPRMVQGIDDWLHQYRRIGRPHILLEISVIGSLSTDGHHFYAVDDLPVPPNMNRPPWRLLPVRDPQFPWGEDVASAMRHNTLDAYDLGSGKMRWSIGGHGDKKHLNDPKSELHDSYFLGPPLPFAGRLYAIHEKKKELRLAVLEPQRGTIERIVPLAKVRDSMRDDTFRRLHAAHATYDNGILVCPTNAGAVVGVDLRTFRVAWGFVYRQDKRVPLKLEQNDTDYTTGYWVGGEFITSLDELIMRSPVEEWKNSAPVVSDGKVVFAAPDALAVYCLNVKDGTLIWKAAKRAGELYLTGVFGEKVLIVGNEKCRALRLADGQEAWSVATGLPSGRGIASANVYYLPLKSAAGTRTPEVCAIDMAKGQITAHVPASKGADGKYDVPGNLLFFEDRLLSQTPTLMVAYPLLTARMKEIVEALQRNPRDPAPLVERGQMRFHRGELSQAVEDLRSALANNPPWDVRDRARYVLFETLTALLQKDFNAREKDLKEYEELCKVESDKSERGTAEPARRRGIYVTVVAAGWEKEGKLREAVQAYLEFAAKAPPHDLLPAPDDPNVRVAPDAWARGRITTLLKRATPEQRKRLEEEIEKRRTK